MRIWNHQGPDTVTSSKKCCFGSAFIFVRIQTQPLAFSDEISAECVPVFDYSFGPRRTSVFRGSMQISSSLGHFLALLDPDVLNVANKCKLGPQWFWTAMFSLRIRIQHFRSMLIRVRIRIHCFDYQKNEKKFTAEKQIHIFLIKNCNLVIPRKSL